MSSTPASVAAAPVIEDDAARMRRGRALMLASVSFFTANALLVRLLVTHFAFDSWFVSSVRFVVGFALVTALSLAHFPGGRIALGALVGNPWLIARGVIGAGAVYLYYYTIDLLGAGRATFINNTYILMGAVLAAVFLREALRPAVVVGLALGIVGVALLTGVAQATWLPTGADALALLGAFASAVVIVIIRRLHQRETTATIFTAQCVWGFAITAAPTVTGWHLPALLGAVLLVLSGLLAGGGQLTMTASYRLLPVAQGSLFQMLVPVGIALGGVVFFGERYSPREAVGAALIVVSCVIAGRARPRLAAGLSPTLQRPPAQ